MSNPQDRRKSIIGCILGTAVGDALGLPYEGISPQRATRLLGPPTRHRFLFGRGMISDDTEHTCMVVQTLIEAGDDADLFARRFAMRLRWWILAFPAGVGKATARSGLKLWLGFPPQRSGVFSAGNGPAMRAAILGAAIDDAEALIQFIRVSSRMTHSDPKAEYGAIAVALAARESARNDGIEANRWLDSVVHVVGEDGNELTELLIQAIQSVAAGQTTRHFADSIGLSKGVTGYTYHTIPVAVHAWLSHPRDYRSAVSSIIQCGGDADTTAAIVGGIVGAGVGRDEIPSEWIDSIRDWPRSVDWMENLGNVLADSIASDAAKQAPRVNPAVVLLRNVVFLLVVLFHGFRRLAPPY